MECCTFLVLVQSQKKQIRTYTYVFLRILIERVGIWSPLEAARHSFFVNCCHNLKMCLYAKEGFHWARKVSSFSLCAGMHFTELFTALKREILINMFLKSQCSWKNGQLGIWQCLYLWWCLYLHTKKKLESSHGLTYVFWLHRLRICLGTARHSFLVNF